MLVMQVPAMYVEIQEVEKEDIKMQYEGESFMALSKNPRPESRPITIAGEHLASVAVSLIE